MRRKQIVDDRPPTFIILITRFFLRKTWLKIKMSSAAINLPSVIKIFQMVTELCSGNDNEIKYGSGDIIRKRRYAELSFLYETLHVDLFYKPTKYH